MIGCLTLTSPTFPHGLLITESWNVVRYLTHLRTTQSMRHPTQVIITPHH